MAKAIVTSLTDLARSWAHSLCHIGVAFGGTENSPVVSITASNYVFALTFSYHGVGSPSARGDQQSRHDAKAGPRLEAPSRHG